MIVQRIISSDFKTEIELSLAEYILKTTKSLNFLQWLITVINSICSSTVYSVYMQLY